jgi:hypothetical protein
MLIMSGGVDFKTLNRNDGNEDTTAPATGLEQLASEQK